MVIGRRTLSAGLSASLLMTALGMTPISAAADPAVPDPRDRPAMPDDVRLTQPALLDDVPVRGNRVQKVTETQRQGFESSGARVVQSDEGLLVIELRDEKDVPTQIVAFDTATDSGIEVIGLAFLDAAEIDAINAGKIVDSTAFGPQTVSAHRNGTNHSHYPGYPFHTCTYVYNWANGDSTFHMCQQDAVFYTYVASGWSGFLIGLFNPVLGFITGLFVFGTINNYTNSDGSIDLFGPAASINSHYGNTYYWGAREGWYYHYPVGNAYYGYARRASNGLLYRTH